MRAYSQDLRERIVQALAAPEESQAEIAERVAVSLSFVEQLWQRWRTTGSCAARPHAGGRQRSLRGAESSFAPS
jgi:transposase